MEDVGYSVEGHFVAKAPGVWALYEALMERLRAFGPVVEEPKKTCIHLVNKSALAGVYPRRDYINLEFKTDYPIESGLIAKSEQISKNRWHHVLRLISTEQLEGDVLKWLRDAYDLSG